MDVDKYNYHLTNYRKRVVKKFPLKILLSNFVGTEQQKDIEKRTQLIDDFFRVKINVKAFDDEERAKKSLKPLDFSNKEEVFSALKNEFDMPYWAYYAFFESDLSTLKKYNNTFIYQLKACNLQCPWCYVDDSNKNGLEDKNSRFFSIEEIIDTFVKQREEAGKNGKFLNNLRPSGGEPTLAVEQWLELLKEIDAKGLSDKVFIQGDTNLTTGHFVEYLEGKGEIKKNLLEQTGEYQNFGLLSSFKGTDTESFCKASGLPEKMSFLHEEQFYALGKIVKAGIDAYPFVYDPNPETLEAFLEKGAKKFGDGFYLKTWIFPLKLYGPDTKRLKMKRIDPEEYKKQLDYNFEKSKEIIQNVLQKKFGVDYQEIPRTDIYLHSD